MKRTNIYLDERQTEALDELAATQGVSRAEVVRNLIDRALYGQDEGLVAGMAAIRDSFGALRDVEFDALVREPDERQRHLERVWNSDK
jgi:hypothetical protein